MTAYSFFEEYYWPIIYRQQSIFSHAWCWSLVNMYIYIYKVMIHNIHTTYIYIYFPTCQVRVVRFYHSCSPPPPPPPHPAPSPPASPPPPLHPLPRSLPPCQLFAKLFANFRTQWALLDLNCKGLSPLGTAGPQPGTFWAQWAPLELNLGPSELSEHRWTSTWDPPSSVSTAGPQPGTLRAQWAPPDLNGQIECQKICQIERRIECQKECQKICQIECQKICLIKCQKICQIECQKVCQIDFVR